jgi:hypothetical protein
MAESISFIFTFSLINMYLKIICFRLCLTMLLRQDWSPGLKWPSCLSLLSSWYYWCLIPEKFIFKVKFKNQRKRERRRWANRIFGNINFMYQWKWTGRTSDPQIHSERKKSQKLNLPWPSISWDCFFPTTVKTITWIHMLSDVNIQVLQLNFLFITEDPESLHFQKTSWGETENFEFHYIIQHKKRNSKKSEDLDKNNS